MSLPIQFPDIVLAEEPTPEELEAFRFELVSRASLGQYVDIFEIKNLPLDIQTNLHYEWAPTDNLTENRMASMGFVRNDALAARSTYLNPTSENGNMIQDVACYTIHKKKKQAMNEAFEINKRLKADPRRTYSEIANELDSSFISLPEKDMKENKRTVISGVEAKAAAQSDWIKSTPKS